MRKTFISLLDLFCLPPALPQRSEGARPLAHAPHFVQGIDRASSLLFGFAMTYYCHFYQTILCTAARTRKTITANNGTLRLLQSRLRVYIFFMKLYIRRRLSQPQCAFAVTTIVAILHVFVLYVNCMP